jgi:hypothetical protein
MNKNSLHLHTEGDVRQVVKYFLCSVLYGISQNTDTYIIQPHTLQN